MTESNRRKKILVVLAVILLAGLFFIFYRGNRIRITGGTVTLYSGTVLEDGTLETAPFRYDGPGLYNGDFDFVVVGIKFDYAYFMDGTTLLPHLPGCDGFNDSITDMDMYWYDTKRDLRDNSAFDGAYFNCMNQVCHEGVCRNEPCFQYPWEFLMEYNRRDEDIEKIAGNEFFFVIGLLKHNPRIDGISLTDENLVIKMDLTFQDGRKVSLNGAR